MYEYEDDFDYGPSKSQLKRDAEAKQDLGASLMNLSNSDLDGLDLPTTLFDAVVLAKELKSGSGLKRQKQLIGKLMRQFDDEEYDRLAKRVEGMRAGSEQQKMIEKWVENKVERLLNQDDSVTNDITSQIADLDFQYMRQLTRNSINEIKKGGKSKSRTLLFRYLREKFEENS